MRILTDRGHRNNMPFRGRLGQKRLPVTRHNQVDSKSTVERVMPNSSQNLSHERHSELQFQSNRVPKPENLDFLLNRARD